jgi:hypothetical protein
MLTKKMVEDLISRRLEEYSLEEILEDFDIDATEAFWILFKLGHIDQELMENLYER